MSQSVANYDHTGRDDHRSDHSRGSTRLRDCLAWSKNSLSRRRRGDRCPRTTTVAEHAGVMLLPMDVPCDPYPLGRRLLRLYLVLLPDGQGASTRGVGIRYRREGGHEGDVEAGAETPPDGGCTARLPQWMVLDLRVATTEGGWREERQCTG